jgi:hypothetical protein
MSILRPAVLAVLLLGGPSASAATISTVVDIPTRPGVTQRFLHVRPDAPKANILYVSGGTGRLDIHDDGTMTTQESRCGPVIRNRQAFADAGFGQAFLDMASNGAVGAYPEVLEVIAYLRARDAVPTWIMGASAATEAIAGAAATLPLSEPAGVMFLSPAGQPFQTGSIRRPAMVVYHAADAQGSPAAAASIYANLTSAPVKEIVVLTGGSETPGCPGAHTFDGIDDTFVTTISGLINKHNLSLSPAPAVAVEFYHAALDHYFLTHIANEIALLDAGTTIKGWVRTGQSFNVYTSAQAGSSPVCRYYIPPELGNSHFYGRGTAECTATGAANPTFVNEDPQFFQVMLPVFGVCPAGTRNVYRVFSNRPDVNHRYMVVSAIRDQMVANGWLAEGDGPDLVVMCSPV